MELFDEVKNRYFQLVFKIINESAKGKEKNEIIKIIQEGEFEEKVIGKNQQSFLDLMLNKCSEKDNLHLIKEKEGTIFPIKESESLPILPVRLTKLEKAWMKCLVEQPHIKMIVSEEILSTLKSVFKEEDSPIKTEYIEMTNVINLPKIVEKETYEKNFAIILDALLLEKPIRYTNIDKNNNIHGDKLSLPVALEYSMRDGRFRVSMYSIDDNRPIMANLFSLSNVRIVDEQVNMDRETAKKLLFEQKYSKSPIVMEVTDTRGAMERCFMCFSGLERTAKALGNNKYEVSINYYMFEEENLIRSIISLGPYVKVLSPERIQKEIIKRVKKSLKFATK